jgi:hypothetical protein
MNEENLPITSRLITFNCLSPYYARPAWFYGVQKQYLDSNYRLQRLKSLMQSWFKVNFIIALQELNDEWLAIIEPFCIANNYSIVASTYSDGMMGVAIAFPHRHYQLMKTDIFDAPGSVRADIQKMRDIVDITLQDLTIDPSDSSDFSDSLEIPKEIQNVDSSITTIHAMTKVMSSFSNAENKTFDNSLLSVLLRALVKGVDSGVELLITTYHMPCRFTEPIYMSCQARAMMSHLEDILRSYSQFTNESYTDRADLVDIVDRQSMGLILPRKIIPIVMADCNIDPMKPPYWILTSRDKSNSNSLISEICRAYSGIGLEFLPNLPMQSAFVIATGSEPAFTNVKFRDPNELNSTDFIETIDYILVPEGTNIKSVQLGLTPKDGEAIGPYPNAICPSDHLPLSVCITI